MNPAEYASRTDACNIKVGIGYLSIIFVRDSDPGSLLDTPRDLRVIAFAGREYQVVRNNLQPANPFVKATEAQSSACAGNDA